MHIRRPSHFVSGRDSLCQEARTQLGTAGVNLREELVMRRVALVDCPRLSLAERQGDLQREEQVYLHLMVHYELHAIQGRVQ